MAVTASPALLTFDPEAACHGPAVADLWLEVGITTAAVLDSLLHQARTIDRTGHPSDEMREIYASLGEQSLLDTVGPLYGWDAREVEVHAVPGADSFVAVYRDGDGDSYGAVFDARPLADLFARAFTVNKLSTRGSWAEMDAEADGEVDCEHLVPCRELNEWADWIAPRVHDTALETAATFTQDGMSPRDAFTAAAALDKPRTITVARRTAALGFAP